MFPLPGFHAALFVQAFEDMQAAGCRPDGAVYSIVINALWCSGVQGPRAKAIELYAAAISYGLFSMAAHVSIIEGVLEVRSRGAKCAVKRAGFCSSCLADLASDLGGIRLCAILCIATEHAAAHLWVACAASGLPCVGLMMRCCCR